MLTAVRTSLAVALLTLLTGCAWFEDEAIKPAELVDFEPTVELDKVWSKSTGDGQDDRFTRFVPAFVGDRVYIADYEGRIVALNNETGKKIWQNKTELPVSGATGAGSGLVLVGTYDAEVVAFNAEDGAERWRARASSEILAPPQTNGDVVVVQTVDGRVFAYDHATGEPRWSYDHALPLLTLRTTSAPLLTEDQLFIGFDNGQLANFNPENGVLRWTVRIGQPQGRSDLERIVDVDASPLMSGSIVYAGAYQGSVTAVSRGTGRELWKQDASVYHDMAYDNGLLFAVLEDSRVVAYNGTSGTIAWENDQMLRRGLSGPATLDGYVATVDEDGYMHVLSQTDGNFAQRLKPPGGDFRSPLTRHGDMLYVLSDNGRLTAYTLPEQAD